MRALGVTSYIVNGGETRTLDVLEVDGGRAAWTVALANGGPAATFDSTDPAVAAFLREVFAFRALPSGPARSTSPAAPSASPPARG